MTAVLLSLQVFSAVNLIINGAIVPTRMVRGGTYTITVYVKNIGSTSITTNFVINVSINSSADYNGKQKWLTDIKVSGLSANTQKTVTTTITIPCSYAAGTQYILLGADGGANVSESNEKDNNLGLSFLNKDLASGTVLNASNIKTTSLTANWQATQGATSYIFQLSKNSSFTSIVSGYDQINVGNVTSKTISNLPCGTDFYYRIKPQNGCGEGGWSSGKLVSTLSCSGGGGGTCPSQTAPSLNQATKISTTGFRINWAITNGASGYIVELSTKSDFSTLIFSNNVGNNTYLDVSGLNCSIRYYYRVRAYNNCGNASTNSSSNTTTSSCVTTCPTILVPTIKNPTNVTSTGFRANWSSVANASGYKVDVSTNSNFTSFVYKDVDAGNNTSIDFSNLQCGSSYVYRVKSYEDVCGSTSGNSQYMNVNTTSCSPSCVTPSIPSNFVATALSSSEIELSWNAATLATGYDIFRCDGTYVQYVAAPATSVKISGLPASTNFIFKLQAQNGSSSCISGQTACKSATTLTLFVNPVPLSILSPVPSLPNSSIYQSALPDALYNASVRPIVCRPQFTCKDVFLYQTTTNPDGITKGELMPRAFDCFKNLQNSWDLRQRGFITNYNSKMCNTQPCSSKSVIISHSQNACAGKDDRYAWDMNIIGGSKDDANVLVFAVEDGVVYDRSSNYITLEHTNNGQKWYSRYDNVTAKPTLVKGTTVSKKQNIAFIRGDVTFGPHLHFGVYYLDANKKFIAVNRPITANYTDINGNPFSSTTIKGRVTGSIIKDASIFYKRDNEWFLGGASDDDGRFEIKLLPGASIGDSIKVFASGYEPISIKLNEIQNDLDFKIPMIKNNYKGISNPSFTAKDPAAFYSNSIVPVVVSGNGYTKYDLYKINPGEEDDDYIPISLNHSYTDSLINISLSDTAENLFGIYFYGADTVLVTKSFFYNPTPSNTYKVNISPDSSSMGALIYINGNLVKKITNTREDLTLLPVESTIRFFKLGFRDTSFVIAGNRNIDLRMSPIDQDIFTPSDSVILDFIRNGKVQYWKKATFMDSLQKIKVVIKQYEKDYSELKLKPVSRTISVSNLSKPYSSNVEIVTILDKMINFSTKDVYLLRILDGKQYFKIPFNSSVADYDSAFQKLTYNGINFGNGFATQEAIVMMKKQAAVVNENPNVTILTNDSLRLPRSLFVDHPDDVQNDLSVIVNRVSQPNKFAFSVTDSFVTIRTVDDFSGDVFVNVTAIHDFTAVTKDIHLKVIASNVIDTLAVYPNPSPSNAVADIYSKGGTYTLKMFDLQGRLIKTFFENRRFARGHHLQNLDLLHVPAGTYILRLNNKAIKFIKMD